ncbi:hypothetical protein BDR26DRAFT_1006746 [Obelidium mucronatum]|nr:hypothetical protein BDR26DRAFT_1006746 [Obelidium mucronatum]
MKEGLTDFLETQYQELEVHNALYSSTTPLAHSSSGSGQVMSKVIVIGSGPAGALTAIALKKQGLEPTLYDKVDPLTTIKEAAAAGETPVIQFGEVGGSISLYGNGLRVLRNMGLHDAIEELRSIDSFKTMRFMLMDGSDPVVRNIDTKKPGELPQLSVYRSRFHSVLMRAVHSLGIRVFSGKKIKNLTQDASGVTVEFEDGTAAFGDLLVGADGIHSKTRQLIFEDAPKPVCFGTGYLGVLDRGGNAIYFNRCGTVEGSFQVLDLNFSTIDQELDDWRPVANLPKEAEKLAATVDSWGAPKSVGTCIRHSKRITPVNIYDLPDLPTFYKGRVVLVGDAAHGTLPTYGQGLNQALEDAAALGDLFGHFKEDYKQAFEVYNKVRLPRAHKCSELARSIASRFKAPSPFAMKFGRFVMKVIFTITNMLELNDAIAYHDYRKDLVEAVPGIQFS